MPDPVRLGEQLPGTAPAEVQLLGRCVRAGLPAPPARLVLPGPDGSDAQLVARLGPLPPGRIDLHPVAHGVDPARELAPVAQLLRAAARSGTAVLVQAPPAAVHSGRAELRRGRDHDVVRSLEGPVHELDDPAADVRTLLVPVLRHRWVRAHRGADAWRTPLPPWGMRLSRLLRDVRRVLGDADLEVAFADDGRTCWLLGVRPTA